MPGRPRHPNKEIEAAVRDAELLGWVCQMANGHAWGRLYCPQNNRDGCIISVWSTPRNPENHANTIKRLIGKCSHGD